MDDSEELLTHTVALIDTLADYFEREETLGPLCLRCDGSGECDYCGGNGHDPWDRAEFLRKAKGG